MVSSSSSVRRASRSSWGILPIVPAVVQEKVLFRPPYLLGGGDPWDQAVHCGLLWTRIVAQAILAVVDVQSHAFAARCYHSFKWSKTYTLHPTNWKPTLAACRQTPIGKGSNNTCSSANPAKT